MKNRTIETSPKLYARIAGILYLYIMVAGSFAEYVCAKEHTLVLKSPKMSFEQAAAIPQAGMLAVQGLIDKGKIRQGQKILINGAGGGVGTLGVQIAKQFEIEVTGVDHTDKLEMMRTIGFDYVIDYTKEDFTETGKRYDLIIDTKTNRSVFAYCRVLSPDGIYATVGGDISRLLTVFLLGPLITMFSKKKLCIVALKPNKDLVFMNELFDTGKLKPVIDGRYLLEQLPEAMHCFGEGKHKGKMVITVTTIE